jgi:pyruvate/2-oxoglutarate dehydrogenase complex dihydrolipoamide dehydrogenase (E3) component
MTEDYDLVVLGSGAGGKLLSWTLAAKGQRVAVIERKYVGGSCPNIACLPSKNVFHSAKVASYLRREEFGVRGGLVDMAAVRDRKRKMVDGLVAIHLQKYQASGSELVMGSGRFVGQDHRGHAQRRRHAHPEGEERRHQYRLAGAARRHTRAGGISTSDPRRGS